MSVSKTSSFDSTAGNTDQAQVITTILKWILGIYWYGAIVLAGLALVFFIFVGSMTSQRFPFPFQAPVTVSFDALDSLEFKLDTKDKSGKEQGIEAGWKALKADINDINELDSMAYKAFSINGDLMFGVPMKTLWPFLLLGFFPSIAIALAIAFQLRRIFRSVNLALPFDPANIKRVKIIGWLVMIIDPLHSIIAWWSANSLLPRVADFGHKVESAFSFDFQSILFGLLILALVQIFQTGARLQQDQELTI